MFRLVFVSCLSLGLVSTALAKDTACEELYKDKDPRDPIYCVENLQKSAELTVYTAALDTVVGTPEYDQGLIPVVLKAPGTGISHLAIWPGEARVMIIIPKIDIDIGRAGITAADPRMEVMELGVLRGQSYSGSLYAIGF